MEQVTRNNRKRTICMIKLSRVKRNSKRITMKQRVSGERTKKCSVKAVTSTSPLLHDVAINIEMHIDAHTIRQRKKLFLPPSIYSVLCAHSFFEHFFPLLNTLSKVSIVFFMVVFDGTPAKVLGQKRFSPLLHWCNMSSVQVCSTVREIDLMLTRQSHTYYNKMLFIYFSFFLVWVRVSWYNHLPPLAANGWTEENTKKRKSEKLFANS